MTTPETSPDDTTADDLRKHAEAPAEGSEDAPGAGPDEPREHAEDPAEG